MPTHTPKTARPVAYSYVRFSTAKQLLGDSLRRQVEDCEKYCRENDLELHPVSYRDLGVSAFKRRNVEKGALAAFIDAVEKGLIEKGSYLIIEQFDRLTRDDADAALELLLHLIRKCGIVVVTLFDKKIWDRKAIKDTVNLMTAMIYMSRANNESVAKSDRLYSFWGNKKRLAATGELKGIVTSECPRWLIPRPDKSGFNIDEAKAESIRKVFQMRISGFGISSIVTRANQEKWPVPGKLPVRKPKEEEAAYQARLAQGMNWHTSTVGRLLKNRALLGEYQPHQADKEIEGKRNPEGGPIKDYYPAILDEDTFLRAAAKAERNGRFPGRRDASLKNWLQGLLFCPCGHTFVRKNKDSKAQPEYARYYCTARSRGMSKCPGASAKEIEDAVILSVSKIFPMYFRGGVRVESLKSEADVLEANVAAATQRQQRYAEAIGSADESISVLLPLLNAATAEVERLKTRLKAARSEMADMTGNSDEVVVQLIKSIRTISSLDARAAVREELARVVDRIVAHVDSGYIAVFARGDPDAHNQGLGLNGELPPSASGGLTYSKVDMSLEEWQKTLK